MAAYRFRSVSDRDLWRDAVSSVVMSTNVIAPKLVVI